MKSIGYIYSAARHRCSCFQYNKHVKNFMHSTYKSFPAAIGIGALLFFCGCARNVQPRESPTAQSEKKSPATVQRRQDVRKPLCEARNYPLPEPTTEEVNIPNYRQCYRLEKQLVDAAAIGDTAGIKKTLTNGAHPEGTYYQSVSALEAAAAGGHLEAATLLLEYGAAVDRIGHLGSTALTAAASEGRLSIVRLLVENGADVCLGDAGETAIDIAKDRRKQEVVDYLTSIRPRGCAV